jgi:hypothetical protein
MADEIEIELEHRVIAAQAERDERHGIHKFTVPVGEELRISNGDTARLRYAPSKTATVIITVDIIE